MWNCRSEFIFTLWLPVVVACGSSGPERPSGSVGSVASAADTAAVSGVLDAFHRAASEADAERYFGLFAEDAVFLGTDATERWTRGDFEEYARPYFDAGQGWTYVPIERRVSLASGGAVAWFDELLENQGLGLTRGTGVLVREGGEWRVAQYNLTIPVPNEVAADVVELIRPLR